MNKNALTLVGTLAAALTLVACGSSSPSARMSRTPTPTPTAPSWAVSYTAAELDDYNAALAALVAIEQREEPIWSGGKLTAVARAAFASDWFVPALPMRRLTSWQQNGAREEGLPRVLSSRLTSLTRDNGSSGIETLTIRQCVDSSGVVATQNGKVVPPSKGTRGVRSVEMDKLPNGEWRIFQIESAGKC